MKVKMYSYGGSGLKFLTKFLKDYVDVHHLHHNPHTLPDKLEGDKSIFLIADPIEALMSFFRREEINQGWVNEHLHYLGKPPIKHKTLEDLAKSNEDPFDLEGFFDKCVHLHDKDPSNSLFLKYEEICKNAINLSTFLKINDGNFESNLLNSFKPRVSNKSNCSKIVLEKLESRFSSLYKKIKSLK